MFSIILILLYIFVLILMMVLPPVLWAMTRLRLIYPISYLIAYLICEEHEDWFITKCLDYHIPNLDCFVGDLLFVLVLILSAASLIKELIQMIFEEFTWSGLFVSLIKGIWLLFVSLIKGILFVIHYPSSRRERKTLREQEEKKRELEKQMLIKFLDARKRVYDVMPDMEKEYYYFKSVCTTQQECADFDVDWKCYINEADRRLEEDENNHYTFDMWFGDNKKWKTRTYYKDFLARDRQQSY